MENIQVLHKRSWKKINWFTMLIILFFLISVPCSYAADHTVNEVRQEKVITGTVTDETGEPLIGVSVSVKGTTTGTMTDIDGKYSLSVPGSSAIIVFTYVGYDTQEFTVGNQSSFSVVMKSKDSFLDEVVVVGYGVQKKALLTGANSNLKGDEITAVKQTSVMEALQGIAPGVNVTRNSGAVGAGTKVTIRGMGTAGNSDPLYIVDGVAVGNIDYLSSSDIQSIDILKDAASAAIYGSRAANGVVLVTTVKGEKNAPPRLSYDGYFGVQNMYKKPSTLNAQEYMFIIDEALANQGTPTQDWQALLSNHPYLDQTFGKGMGAKYGEHIWNKLQSGWKGTDWVDEITKSDAPIQNHAINITGSSKDVIYSLGFSYFNQKSLVGGDVVDAGIKRYTARLNTEIRIFKRGEKDLFTIGENLTYTNTYNKDVGNTSIYYNDLHDAIVANPLMPVYWDSGNASVNAQTFGFAPNFDGYGSGNIMNPYARLYTRHQNKNGHNNTIVGNVYAVLEPIDRLKFRSSLGVNAWFGDSRSYTPLYKIGRFLQSLTDRTSQSTYMGADVTWTNTLSYDMTFNGMHKIAGLVGTEWLTHKMNLEMGGSKNNSLFPGSFDNAYIDNTLNASSVADIATNGRDWAAQGGGLVSYFGHLEYNFKEKYMIDFTLRADGSSNFAPGKRWGYFPSVSAGWNFSEEDFFKGSNIFTYGKLRASWGQNGNQDIGSFVYLSNIANRPRGYYFGPNRDVPNIAAVPNNVPNPDVTWETSEQINFGLDSRFLNSRLGFTFDYFVKNTKDWLVVAPILGTSGAGAPWVNGGDVRNSGFEIALDWRDSYRDFKYGVTLTGSAIKNKVTRLANAEGIIPGPDHVIAQGTSYVSRIEVGKPMGFFYGYQTNGIFQNQAEVDAYVDKDGKRITVTTEEDIARKPGDVRFVDQNGDGKIDENDKVMIGKYQPDFEMGIQLNAEYKGVYLTSTLVGKFGLQVMQSYRSFSDMPYQNYTTEIFGRWHGEGTSNRLPRLAYTSTANNLPSDIYVHDADYLRITNLTIGYRFDKLLRKQSVLKQASVYVSINNLYTFTNYSGMDPEVGYGNDSDTNNSRNWAQGIDLGLFPLPRTVMFGVNVTF